MSPGPMLAAWVASLFGVGLGVFGFVESAPLVAGGGFAVTVSLQLWTMTKLGPINVRLAVIEERLSKLEDETLPRMHRRPRRHSTPPIE